MKGEVNKLKGRKSVPNRQKNNSFNIIQNKDIDYFDIENYSTHKKFKQVNDTSEVRKRPSKSPLKFVDKILHKQISPQKYKYSGMSEHQLLSYSIHMNDQTKNL